MKKVFKKEKITEIINADMEIENGIFTVINKFVLIK